MYGGFFFSIHMMMSAHKNSSLKWRNPRQTKKPNTICNSWLCWVPRLKQLPHSPIRQSHPFSEGSRKNLIELKYLFFNLMTLVALIDITKLYFNFCRPLFSVQNLLSITTHTHTTLLAHTRIVWNSFSPDLFTRYIKKKFLPISDFMNESKRYLF